MENNHRENQPELTPGQQYWKANVRIIAFCLSIWALVGFGFPILLRPMLTSISIGGTDLGFWFAQQGGILCFIGIIFTYAYLMNRLDKKYNLEDK